MSRLSPRQKCGILQEISRFESVHPCIYATYEMLELFPETHWDLAGQIREYIVNIEGW